MNIVDNYYPHHPSCRTFGQRLVPPNDPRCNCMARRRYELNVAHMRLFDFCCEQLATRSKPHATMKTLVTEIRRLMTTWPKN